MQLNRRTFLRGAATAGALTLLPRSGHCAISPNSYATLIDLSRCDGCAGRESQLCISACRTSRAGDMPKPKKDQIKDYWPQKKHEDWSDKRHVTDRFTPYNWLFIQQVEVDGQQLHVPRRCMHCDNPPCAKLCPFGIKHKTAEGPVYIDTSLCLGGAKCRSVCPWSVPQRQAGVGIYTLWQKYIPAGGGVMYKCDLCRDRLSEGLAPSCIDACPNKAMEIGTRQEIEARAKQLKDEYNGDIYGLSENGGTSTYYISKVPFADINAALRKQSQDNPQPQTPMHQPENMLERQNGLALLSLASPLVGGLIAYGFSGSSSKEEDK